MAETGERPVKVLIVDDSASDAEQIEGWLRSTSVLSFDIESCDRLAAALSRLDRNDIELVLLDLFLPESKGLKTLRRLRERAPGVTVIALTRFEDEHASVQALREGAQDYLAKSEISGSLLLRAIRHALERKSIEEQLRNSEERHRTMAELLSRANVELEGFTYSVSHDLRAPLRAITGFTEILDRDYRSQLDEKAGQYLDRIISAGQRMGWLIDDLLAYSRLGHESLKTEQVKLDDLFAQVVNSLAARIEENGATIELPEELPAIYGHPTLLTQIFSNLLSNAITFHRPGESSRVVVGCRLDSDDCTLSVSDNGIGISPEYLDKIFDIFQRLHRQDEFPGTGIGLAIVKKSVELLGGTVTVDSEEGRGTTFTVVVPNSRRELVSWRSS